MKVWVYTDGGLLGKNPSPVGGTWAWRIVGEDGSVIAEDSGVHVGRRTAPRMELEAAIKGLQAAPYTAHVVLCSDSEVTLRRLVPSYNPSGLSGKFVGVPLYLRGAAVAMIKRGRITAQLLKGHPSKADLERGETKRGVLVSIHNVWCDQACKAAGLAWLAEQKEQENADGSRTGAE